MRALLPLALALLLTACGAPAAAPPSPAPTAPPPPPPSPTPVVIVVTATPDDIGPVLATLAPWCPDERTGQLLTAAETEQRRLAEAGVTVGVRRILRDALVDVEVQRPPRACVAAIIWAGIRLQDAAP